MTWTVDDIIAAVASPPGAGVRGIVRASGPGVQSLLIDSFRCEGNPDWSQARTATRFPGGLAVAGLSISLPVDLWFWPNRRSYAGQPTVEIHTIGSPPILDAIVQDLVGRGARLAQPGEFTLRAFLSGKIDLVQAEAVLGVIDADTTERLQQALNQLSGGVSHRIQQLREELLIDLADLEAGLDFVDEDIEFVDRDAMSARLRAAVEWLQALRQQTDDRGRTTGRRQVVLAGLPNAGKSTLFNALAGRDAAVVSSQAGTTRDWLTAELSIDGLAIDLIDTAGWEDSHDPIALQAQSARDERGRFADLVLWCTARDAATAEDDRRYAETASRNPSIVRVSTKSDRAAAPSPPGLPVSAATGAGLDELRQHIRCVLESADGQRGELLTSTLARCRGSLDAASEALERALGLSVDAAGEELVALELRRGLDALGEIAGAVYTDDLLDRIFSRFCIGK